MLFLKTFISSRTDLPGYHALVAHSISSGCNLNCYQCFNKSSILDKKHNSWYNEDDLIRYLKLNEYLFDAIILSGGEFLNSPIDEIHSFLTKLKEFNKIIIINTNGLHYAKINSLIDLQLVSGFHMDYKFPVHLSENCGEWELAQEIFGRKLSEREINCITNSLGLIIANNSPYSRIRTVQYPIMPSEYFIEMADYIDTVKQLFKSEVPYDLNPFIPLEQLQ